MQFKKDPWVIGLAAAVVIVLGTLTFYKVITWEQMAAGVVLFGLPSVFGRSKEGATCVLLAVTVSACTPGQRAIANSALDVAKTACIIAHQMLPDTEVAKICGIADPFIAPMKDILTSARVASSQAIAASRVGTCPSYGRAVDGGAP